VRSNLKTLYKIAIVCIVIVAFAVPIYLVKIFEPIGTPLKYPLDKLSIQAVEVSSNHTLNVFVNKISNNSLTIISARIQNEAGGIVWETGTINALNETLTDNNPTTVKVNLVFLPSGTYNIILRTSSGCGFKSPPFNIGDK
jgi:hypothetical protein